MATPKPAGPNGMTPRWVVGLIVGVCALPIGLLAAVGERQSAAQTAVNEQIEVRVNACEWSAAAGQANMEHVLEALRDIRATLREIQRDLKEMREVKR